MGNQYTGSIGKGPLTPHHNRRLDHEGNPLTPENCPDNIDLTKTPDNVVIIDRHLPELYRETFGKALEQYNAAQVAKGHPGRQISDYYEHVLHSKQTNVAYEYVIQVGNKDERPDPEVAEEIYREWLKDIQERYKGNFVVAQAIIHVDETTSHMHLEIIPTAKSERGLPLQNSLNKAIKQAGYEQTKEVPRPYNAMLGDWDKMLTERMREHGIERIAGDKERQFGGVPIRAVRAASAYQEARKIEADKLVQDAKQESKAWEQAAEQAKEQTAAQQQATQAAQIKQAKANIAAVQAEQRAQQATEQTQQAKGELAQVQQDTLESRVELGRCQEQIAEKQALAGDLERQNAEKTAEIEGLKDEIGRFSAEKEAVEDRLEWLRPREAELAREVDQLKEQVAEQEHAPATPNPGDDRQAAGQEQQEQAQDQGRSLGEQGASLWREAATAIQRAGQGEGADARGLDELRDARAAAQERVAELESKRDATAGRVGELEKAYERAAQKDAQARSQEQAAEGRLQQARERLQDARDRIDGVRERFAERVTELRQQLGCERAIEIVRDVRDRVCQGREMLREMLGDRAANRVNDALAQHQEPQAEQQQEYSARDWVRYEMDMGRER